ncbi:MAG: Flagellar hook-associated protein FlgK [Clostridia bacterium 62_21]|nr:MAG: Flagellar hook-associated protein FlgK [Clostridia bacterium 62_21]
MSSTFFGLEIARRGLMAQRLAMDTAAHNLANANTEGYTRQQAVHVAENPYTIPVRDQKVVPGQIGTGVTVAEIRRVRDTILDAHVRRALGDAGYWEERSDALARVEALFPEPGDYGIQQAIAKFFNYWQDLNNSPQDLGLKAAVREAGEELASMIRVTYTQLEENYNGLKDTLQDKVAEINNLAEEIRGINEAIARLGSADYKANDLMDRRDLLLDKLAAIGEVDVELLGGGQIKVSFYGEVLVDGQTVYEASSRFNDPSDQFILTINGNDVNITNLAEANTPGALSGLESARQKVKGYMDDLDKLANALRDQVNAAHGYDPGPPSGVAFFDPDSTGATDFALDPAILADANQIDGTKALDVAALRDDPTVDADGDGQPDVTFEVFYTQLVTRLGTDVSGAAERVKGAQAVREQLENLRQSVTGVSIDEELTYLTQYQYAYQASARVVTILDEMLDTIINRLGV